MTAEPFSRVHGGLRTLLFDTATKIARTDFGDDAAVPRALDDVRVLLAFLREHATHEDAVVLPELHRVDPELGGALAAEHAALEELHRSLDLLAARIDAGGPQRAALGRELDRRLSLLVARHVLHMEREETEGARALHAALDDAAIEALIARVLASIAPERLREWQAIVAPTLAAAERAQHRGGG